MKRVWCALSNAAVMVCVLFVAGLVAYQNWPAAPWMEPAFEIHIGDDGRPRYTFTGVVNASAPNATYGVDIKANLGGGLEQDVCRGGYNPESPPNYAPGERPPKDKLFSWVIEKYDRSEYPHGCEAELRPGYEHIMYIGWCRAPGKECVSASARWRQP